MDYSLLALLTTIVLSIFAAEREESRRQVRYKVQEVNKWKNMAHGGRTSSKASF